MSKKETTEQKCLPVKNQQIQEAIFSSNHEELKRLLSLASTTEINRKDESNSVLDLAVYKGDEIAVELLLAHGAIPDYNRSLLLSSQCTLAKAVNSDNHKIIELLVNHGCDPDTIFTRDAPTEWHLPASPYNAWYITVQCKNLPIFQLLLKLKGREVCDDEWSQGMFLIACGFGAITIVEYLLDNGVSIESTDKNGWTGIIYAAAYKRIPVFELLVGLGGNVRQKDNSGRNIFHVAILYCQDPLRDLVRTFELFQLFIDSRAEINARDKDGLTPINTALTVQHVNDNIIKMFLNQPDVDLSKSDNRGITVLHRIISTGRLYFLKDVLRRFDVDINALDVEGRTPLLSIEHTNFHGCYKQYLSLLLEFGADTKDLSLLKKDVHKDLSFLKVLAQYGLKRSVASLSDDLNINNLLTQHSNIFSRRERAEYVSEYSNEIERMKGTILCGSLTFYDFLHAKKRTCINVGKKSELRELLMERNLNFENYSNMLTKNYISGVRPLTKIESKAINSLDTIFYVLSNYKLPNLVVHKIKKYIDIEDMVTLYNTKVLDLNDIQNDRKKRRIM